MRVLVFILGTWKSLVGIRISIIRESAPTLDEEVIIMKNGIHPATEKVMVHCACGETFETISTSGELRVDICSKCHPFYTGKQKLIDAGGRVDKFKKRMGTAQ